MTSRLPGITGTLFPGQFLAEGLAPHVAATPIEAQRRRMEAWWRRVEHACGPATGLRALFDLMAMPLFAMLDFHASDVRFDRHQARVRLATRSGTPVALVVRPWSTAPSASWRDLAVHAAEIGASWAFVLAPPFLSLVDGRGLALRRSVDVEFPRVLDNASFQVFWKLAHATALGDEGPGSLDAVVNAAARFEAGVRADLQHGVVDAMRAVVSALARTAARRDADARFHEALTIVYRVLFLLFAESRDLVPHHHPVYRDAYTIGNLCREAQGPSVPVGLWDALAAITRLSRVGCRGDDFIVQPFNGRLFARNAAPSLETRSAVRRANPRRAALDNALRRTLIALGSRPGRAGRESISYADLGVEQLGAVYERVLDLDPATLADALPHAQPAAPSSPPRRHSVRRKESGTFYTPQTLCDFVVRRTLAPLVTGIGAEAILALRVVDPAMGSGAFLVSACRFLAEAYAHALVDEGRVAEADLDEAARADIRRLIAERCLTGVDANPVAVQLARLSLWLATLAEGRPLGFLDHRLRTGNSLIGAWPDDLSRSTGRRRSPVRALDFPLFDAAQLETTMQRIARPIADLLTRRDHSVADVHAKEAIWNDLSGERSPLRPWRLASSLWCARWFWRTGTPPSASEIRAAIDAVLKGDRTLRAHQLSRLVSATDAIDTQLGFFHWPLEFPDVFYDEHGQPKDRAGFDAVIGNPPWEMLRGDAAARRDAAPDLVRFVRDSGLFPSCDRGHMNLYQPFMDRALAIARPGGRVGLVLPWGLAVDDGASALRATLLDRTEIDTIVGIDNVNGIFPIHRGVRFLALVTSTGGPSRDIRTRFGVKTTEDIASLPGATDATSTEAWPVRLTPSRLRAIGGPARRLPDLRRPGDLELLERLAAAFPPVGATMGWHARFGRELNATEDREHFGGRGLPVAEGKHVQPFVVDARSAPRRIERARASRLLPDRRFDRDRLAYRDVSGVGNKVSLIAAIVPAGVVTTHTLFCLRGSTPIEQQHFLCALFNSYVLNAVVRLLMGSHVTTTLVEGLPAPVWTGSARQRRIARLARRLSDGSRDPRLGARLHAGVALEYGLDVVTFERILDAFPLVDTAERERARDQFRGDFAKNRSQ